MGGKNSKVVSKQLGQLETKIKGLTTSIFRIQDNINALPKDYILQSELDQKLVKIEEDSIFASQQLSQLVDLTKDQQQVILDLGDQYTQVCDICENQQESVELIESRCKEKLVLYEEEILDASKKLDVVEQGIHRTTELAKIMGIRKTENMIKKEKVNPPSIAKKSESVQKRTVEEKTKPKEQVSVAKSGKKSRKSTTRLNNGANENDATHKIDNPLTLTGKTSERKGLGSTHKESITKWSTHKESLSKSDFNIF